MWRETSILFALQDPCGIKWDKGWVRSFRTHVYWPDSGNHSVLFPVSEGSPVRNTASSSLAKCHKTRTTEMSCDKEQLVCMAEERLCPENHLNRRKRNLEKKISKIVLYSWDRAKLGNLWDILLLWRTIIRLENESQVEEKREKPQKMSRARKEAQNHKFRESKHSNRAKYF